MLTHAEENYLKAIYKIGETNNCAAQTTEISVAINTTTASVTDMLKKLSEKKIVNYEKYHGVTLTDEGLRTARTLIRKHRLWEVFLCEKLGYGWDECHDMAEQLEHIRSEDLSERLDSFLNYPHFDPHGDPIPDKNGVYTRREQQLLNTLQVGESGIIAGVCENSSAFLQHLSRIGFCLGVELTVVEVFPFDGSQTIKINDADTPMQISRDVNKNIFVTR